MNLSIMIDIWLKEKSNEATWKVLLQQVEGPVVNNRQVGDNIRTFLRKLIKGIQLTITTYYYSYFIFNVFS